MDSKYIYTESLCKTYYAAKNKGVEVKALQDVNIEIQQGEILAITGSSGSGKSTLLHILGGINTPTGGSVFYGEENICRFSDKKLSAFRKEKTGFVFQFFNLFPELTVRQNILVPYQLQKKKGGKEKAEELAEALGIKDKLASYPEQLSGGQQQRVAIARALMNSPDLLLCDEPTGNLDEKNGQEVMELLEQARDTWNQTIVIVTHEKSIAEQADRILKLKDGCVNSNSGCLKHISS